MSAPVSIVVPAFGGEPLLAQTLPPLLREVERRRAGDEVVLVDDGSAGAEGDAAGPGARDAGDRRAGAARGAEPTVAARGAEPATSAPTGAARGADPGAHASPPGASGRAGLAAWAAARFPAVRVLTAPANEGFARALSRGIAAARHELVFALNSDVRVHPGFLEPLQEALADERVFAAVPRILLGGTAELVESLVSVRLEGGVARAAQPALEDDVPPRLEERSHGSLDVPFPIGGACLLRRERFLALGGFDPAFEPFYLEDLDLGWRAWKAGWTVRYVGRSVVDHHHRGTIGAVIPREVVLAAIERNRLLFTWKHLDEPELLASHVAQLARRIAEASVVEDRTFLAALCLALEDRAAVLAARAPAGAEPTFERVRRASDPAADGAAG